MRTTTFLALLAVFPSIASAQEAPPPLTVEEAVAQALRTHPITRATAYGVSAARAGIGAARALSNPSVTVTPTIAGPAGSDEELSVVQPLEVTGVRGARTRVARAEFQAARSEATVTVRDLVRDVKLAYFDLARAQEVLALQRESVGIAEEFERIARRQVELGSRPGIDLTQLQIELTRARQLQISGSAGVRVAEATLNTLMGRAAATPIPAVSRLAFSAHASDPAISADGALGRRAEIAAEQARLEALRQQLRLIRTEGRPDLALSGRIESFTSGDHRLGGVGLGITLPFLDYGSRRNRLRQTRRLADAQAAQVEVVRNQVLLDVETALARLRAAEQLVQRYHEGLLDQARRLAEAERTRFQTGAGTPLAVLEAQRTYRSVLSDYYSALAAHQQATAEVEWATGAGPQFRDALYRGKNPPLDENRSSALPAGGDRAKER